MLLMLSLQFWLRPYYHLEMLEAEEGFPFPRLKFVLMIMHNLSNAVVNLKLIKSNLNVN